MAEKENIFSSLLEKLLSKDKEVAQDSLLPQADFLKKHKIKEKDFKRTKYKWSELEEIHDDYVSYKKTIEDSAKRLVDIFMSEEAKNSRVHSVRSRIKNPETLIEKIIRKKLDKLRKKERIKKVTVDNYCIEITDLIGLRVLHVFKNDWQPIHKFIEKHKWVYKDKPKVYYRKGDQREFIKECGKQGCKLEPHSKGYRSIHYIIKERPKDFCYAEIQVRTIFEEGWSEIDHKLRYFTKSKKEHVLDKYSLALNRVAGSADEIGSIMHHRHLELRQEEFNKQLLKEKKKRK